MKKMLYGFVVSILMIASVLAPIKGMADSSDNIYHMGETQKKGKGYEANKTMKESDVHYGWSLGQFQITGYTRKQEMEDGTTLFLKNVGDEISLSFLLEQDITALNGKENIFIYDEDDGYDNSFGISKNDKTDFGCGALLVKFTDYQNQIKYTRYVDYLNGVEKGAETDILPYEEGDYVIALDYEIRKNNIDVWKVHTAPSYSRYQILIKFSVRNGNCMVYPFDVENGSELVNSSFTENGFYLDLANSRYLNIDVKKMNYVESDGTLVEDVRFNRPASDGEKFTDEGLYIITVKNTYTGSETEKKIYVGTDPILKAYVTTGTEIDEIKAMVAGGAIIEEDGTITLATKEVVEEETEEAESEEIPTETMAEENTESPEVEVTNPDKNNTVKIEAVVIVIALAFVAVAVLGIVLSKRKKNLDVGQMYTDEDDSEEKKGNDDK